MYKSQLINRPPWVLYTLDESFDENKHNIFVKYIDTKIKGNNVNLSSFAINVDEIKLLYYPFLKKLYNELLNEFDKHQHGKHTEDVTYLHKYKKYKKIYMQIITGVFLG